MEKPISVLHIGLEESLVERLARRAGALAWSLDRASHVEECFQRIEELEYDVLLTGAALGKTSVERLLEESLRRRPQLAAVIVATQPRYEDAVRLARWGAADYIPAESAQESVVESIETRILRACNERSSGSFEWSAEDEEPTELVGQSKAIRQVIQLVRLIARRQSTVLISGRTGTGKELVARAIHRASPRAGRPLVMVNCGAVPENLIEAEFFGHVRGAFTGAVHHRTGRLEQAHRGTIFLDEISEMPLEMQSKLLRALQERQFERVGSSETLSVDVRVIAATNRDLTQMVERGEFREDLFYRLNVVPISLPCLAERISDIALLVGHLLARICRRENLPLKQAGPEALKRLMEYHWPGNVRQLENAIEKAVALSGDRPLLYPSDFPIPSSPMTKCSALLPDAKLPAEGLDFNSTVNRFERSLMDQALRRSGGNKKRAADLLRIKRTTFAAKWRSLQTADPSG